MLLRGRYFGMEIQFINIILRLKCNNESHLILDVFFLIMPGHQKYSMNTI